jgi:hypothetical protein
MDRKGGRRVVGEEKRKKKEKNSRGESAVNLVLRKIDRARVGGGESNHLALLSSKAARDSETRVTLDSGCRTFGAGGEEGGDNRDDVGSRLRSVERLRRKSSQTKELE